MTQWKLKPWQLVTLWIFGVVFASLIPLLAIYFRSRFNGDHLTFDRLLGHGDLLLISAIVTIAAILEPMRALDKVKENRQAFSCAMAVIGGMLLISCEALWYACISGDTLIDKHVDPDMFTVYGSLFVFAFSAVCGAICVSIAAGGK
ncbi:hypothetical protein [Amycolatopsis sp. cg9]|uniref:hypothetical protein n=1 Tax=Amycolatopsis sp. cg9 TaxID=3238801 RepID=UPI0035254741